MLGVFTLDLGANVGGQFNLLEQLELRYRLPRFEIVRSEQEPFAPSDQELLAELGIAGDRACTEPAERSPQRLAWSSNNRSSAPLATTLPLG